MDVWLTISDVEKERDKMCHNYLEKVMMVGSLMENRSMEVMNSTDRNMDRFKVIIGQMMNGTVNMTATKSEDLMMLAKMTVDSFLNGKFFLFVLVLVSTNYFKFFKVSVDEMTNLKSACEIMLYF